MVGGRLQGIRSFKLASTLRGAPDKDILTHDSCTCHKVTTPSGVAGFHFMSPIELKIRPGSRLVFVPWRPSLNQLGGDCEEDMEITVSHLSARKAFGENG